MFEEFANWLVQVVIYLVKFAKFLIFALMIIKSIMVLQGEPNKGDYGRASTSTGTGSGRIVSNLPEAVSLTGTPVVIDGDTLRIGDELIEISGIDAPELGQPCGSAAAHFNDQSDGQTETFDCGLVAKNALEKIIEEGNGIITCVSYERDWREHLVGHCEVQYNIGSVYPWITLDRHMVATGWALVQPRLNGVLISNYSDAEDWAHDGSRGLWAGTFTPPWEWRFSVEGLRQSAKR